MARVLLLALTAIALLGCVTPEEYEARDRAFCEEKTGVKRDDASDSAAMNAYDQCRRDLEAKRDAARRAQTEWNIGNYRQNVGR